MTLPTSLRETIVATGSIMAEARDPWWIISGAAAALYGANPIIVSDVDVMLSTNDAKRLFSRIGIEPEPPSNHPRFRSEIFGRWAICPLMVEFMASFRLLDLDGVWRPMEPKTRQALKVDGVEIFVPDILELRAMFGRFGRKKDYERIMLLDQIG